MKNLYTILFAMCLSFANAQTDSVFNMELINNRSLNDFAYNSDHSFMVLHGTRILRWERDGDTSGFTIPNLRSYSRINRLADGNFLVFGKSSTFFGKVAKIDSTGSVLWETVIDKGGLQASLYSLYEKADNTLLIGGGAQQREMIAHLSAMGDTLKVIYLPTSSFSGIADIIPTSDGNFLGAGFNDDYPYAVKFDNNLDTLWTFSEIIFISFSEMKAIEQANGNFSLYANRHKVVLDANGQKLLDTLHLNSFAINKAAQDSTGFLAAGMFGTFSTDRGPSIVQFNTNGDSLAGFKYEVPQPISGSYRSIIKLPNGNFAALGNNRDSINTPNPGEYVNLITIFGEGTPNIGIKENLKTQHSIYPNPTTQFIKIDNLKGGIKVYDLQGRNIKTVHSADEGVYDISSLKRGLYIIADEDSNYLGKISKQ